MKTFTFGADHKHPIIGESLCKHYIQVPGEWYDSREIMLAIFGREWAFQYENPEQASSITTEREGYKYDLIELEWSDELKVKLNTYMITEDDVVPQTWNEFRSIYDA